MPNKKIKNKRALVTGATGGIGNAIVAAFMESGMKVVGAGSNRLKLEELSARFPGLIIEKADFTDPNDVERLATSALNHYNGLDVLVNNAGIGISGNVVDTSIEDIRNMLYINLLAPIILSKIIGEYMAAAGSGHIINIGSGASYTPISGMAAYCASKYGLLGFSESLALELREYGVKVSIITPGSTATAFGGGVPDARLINKPGLLLPSDIADTVMCLLYQSERAWTSQVNIRPLNPNKKPKN
jgi:short-subunit dehydrogenase